jgi:DNA-binding MarR family transcriptional regulator
MDGNGRLEIDEFTRNLQLIAFLTRHYIEGEFVAEATGKPISFVHMNLLRILGQNPGRTVGDVARFMNVSYPAATKTIDKLVRLRLVRRREDARDRRVAHLHLTSAGRRMVNKYINVMRGQIEGIVDRFGIAEACELSGHMRKFARCVVEMIPIKAGVCMQCGAFSPEDCSPTVSEKTCGYLDRKAEAGG